jgi:hypothetical protein
MTSDKEKADRQGRAEALYDEQAQRVKQEKRVEGGKADTANRVIKRARSSRARP